MKTRLFSQQKAGHEWSQVQELPRLLGHQRHHTLSRCPNPSCSPHTGTSSKDGLASLWSSHGLKTCNCWWQLPTLCPAQPPSGIPWDPMPSQCHTSDGPCRLPQSFPGPSSPLFCPTQQSEARSPPHNYHSSWKRKRKRKRKRNPETSWTAPTHQMNEANPTLNQVERLRHSLARHSTSSGWQLTSRRGLTTLSPSLRSEEFGPHIWHPVLKSFTWGMGPQTSSFVKTLW